MNLMSTINDWLQYTSTQILHLSFYASFVIILVLFTQTLFRKRLTPQWHCALWFLVLARLIMPVAPATSFSFFNLFPTQQTATQSFRPIGNVNTQSTPSQSSSDYQTHVNVSPLSAPDSLNGQTLSTQGLVQSTTTSFSLTSLLSAIWLVGMSMVLLYTIRIFINDYRITRNAQPLKDQQVINILNRAISTMRLKRNTRIATTVELTSPAVTGIFKPTILIPQHLTQSLTPDHYRWIILHELAHVRRNDVPVNYLMMILHAIHWFNPLVYFAFNRIRTDRELACDHLVLQYANSDNVSQSTCDPRRDYARTMMFILEAICNTPRRSSPIAMADSHQQLHRRLTMITRHHSTSRFATSLGLALLFLISGVGLTNASDDNNTKAQPFNTAEPQQNNIESKPTNRGNIDPNRSVPAQPPAELPGIKNKTTKLIRPGGKQLSRDSFAHDPQNSKTKARPGGILFSRDSFIRDAENNESKPRTGGKRPPRLKGLPEETTPGSSHPNLVVIYSFADIVRQVVPEGDLEKLTENAQIAIDNSTLKNVISRIPPNRHPHSVATTPKHQFIVNGTQQQQQEFLKALKAEYQSHLARIQYNIQVLIADPGYLDTLKTPIRKAQHNKRIDLLTLDQLSQLHPPAANRNELPFAENKNIKSISRPRVTAINNQEANIKVIQQTAYIADYQKDADGTFAPVVKIADAGMEIDVVGTIDKSNQYITISVNASYTQQTGPMTKQPHPASSAEQQLFIEKPQLQTIRLSATHAVPKMRTFLLGKSMKIDGKIKELVILITPHIHSSNSSDHGYDSTTSFPGALAPAKPFDNLEVAPPSKQNIPDGTFNPAVPNIRPNKPFIKKADPSSEPLPGTGFAPETEPVKPKPADDTRAKYYQVDE